MTSVSATATSWPFFLWSSSNPSYSLSYFLYFSLLPLIFYFILSQCSLYFSFSVPAWSKLFFISFSWSVMHYMSLFMRLNSTLRSSSFSLQSFLDNSQLWISCRIFLPASSFLSNSTCKSRIIFSVVLICSSFFSISRSNLRTFYSLLSRVVLYLVSYLSTELSWAVS